MNITRRHVLAAVTASSLLAMPGMAQAVDTATSHLGFRCIIRT